MTAEGPAQASRHLLIAGTGRAGTSALVRLLDACGLETVLRDEGRAQWFEGANAGAESDPTLLGRHPYVIKSPWAYQYIGDLLRSDRLALDQVIIPIRKLRHAAASRVITELAARERAGERDGGEVWPEYACKPGGTLNSLEPIDQERILGRSLHLLVEELEEHETPFFFLAFPRFVDDVEYAFRKLRHLVPGLELDAFSSKFRQVMVAAQVRVEGELEAVSHRAPIPGGGDGVRPTLAELHAAAVTRALGPQGRPP